MNKSYYLSIEQSLQDRELSLNDAEDLSKIDMKDFMKYVKPETVIKCINAIYRIVPNYITNTPCVLEYLLSDKCKSLDQLINIYEILNDKTAKIIFSKITTFGHLLGFYTHCTSDLQRSLLEDALIESLSTRRPSNTIYIPIALKRVHAAIYNRRIYENRLLTDNINRAIAQEEIARKTILPPIENYGQFTHSIKKTSIFHNLLNYIFKKNDDV